MDSTRELFEAVFQSAPDAVIVVGEDGLILHVNRQTAVLFQYAPEELVGATIETLLPERFHRAHAQHRRQYMENCSVRQMGAGLDLSGRRKDGSEFPVDIMLSPLESANPGRILAVVRDMSERRQQEQRVQQSTEMFERLFENSPDAIVVVDSAGCIVRVNAQAAAVFQYPREELLAQPVEMLLPQRSKEIHTRHRQGFLQSPLIRPMGAGLELSARRKDGSEFPVDIMLSPVEQESQGLVLAVVRDITGRKLAEEQEMVRLELRQTELLVREVHHRVKNNLQVVSSLLALQGMAVGDPAIHAMFSNTQSRVNAMALIHEKLYRSSFAGEAVLRFDEYLTDLVRDLTLLHDSNRRGIRLELDLEPVQLHIDLAIPCGLIINELVTNSFKHAFPQGGPGAVSVSMWREGEDAVALRVQDNGIGLPTMEKSGGLSRLGSQLIETLVTQIRGTQQSVVEEGLTTTITIPVKVSV